MGNLFEGNIVFESCIIDGPNGLLPIECNPILFHTLVMLSLLPSVDVPCRVCDPSEGVIIFWDEEEGDEVSFDCHGMVIGIMNFEMRNRIVKGSGSHKLLFVGGSGSY